MRILLPALTGLLATAHQLRAQEEVASDFRGVEWKWAPFVGYAQNSPAGNRWGITPDWNHLFLGVHLETTVLRLRSATLSYAPVVVPLLMLTHHPADAAWAQKPIYAIGLAPFGLRFAIAVSRKHEIFGASAVGGLWSTRPIPDPDARAFNVTLEWGGGVDIAVVRRHSLQLGYKFHHLSNVYTAAWNPGLDGHVVFAGWRSTARLGR